MKSAFITLSAIAAAASAQDLSSMPQCAQTCGNNMMASSKAEELGCSANDLSCLCQNENFGYGFRDCASAICSADEAMMLVEYVVKTCKDAGVEISPGAAGGNGGNGDDNDNDNNDSDDGSSESTGADGDNGMGGAATTMYTTYTNSEGMAVTTPVATQTMGGDNDSDNDSDNDDGMNGGAGGAITYTNSDGSVVVSTMTTMMPTNSNSMGDGSMTTSGPMTTGGSGNDNDSDNNNDNDSDNNDNDSDGGAGGAGGSGNDNDSDGTSTSSGLAAQATAQAGVIAAAGLAAFLL